MYSEQLNNFQVKGSKMSSIAFFADPKDVYETLYSTDASKLANEVHSNALSPPII